MTTLADVALPVPVPRAFTYAVPNGVLVSPGARVVCPFGKGARRVIGVVLAIREGDAPAGTKSIADVLEMGSLPEDLLAFLVDLSRYYFAPIGEVVRLALPPIDREASRATREPSLFDDARGVGSRKVQWVSPTDAIESAPSALKGQPAALLAYVRASGASPLSELSSRWGNARAAARKLADLGLVRLEDRDRIADPFFAEAAPREPPPEPTDAQATAIDSIVRALEAAKNATFLLHGVTGSGKTEVYLRAIAAAKTHGRGVIVLVPEIALTPQLVARFRGRFGDDVCVLHSALTPKERLTMWTRLRAGDVDVAIGARSALFAPVAKLGLVVVDEEHDPSFKQEEGVRYNARDMAILRAHRAGGVCVLGSATPSLETEHLVRGGKATRLSLPLRARAQEMPQIEIVDLRRIGAGPTGDKRISLPLHRAIEKTLADRRQTILFLNRRGFSPSVRCQACGSLASCPHCSVALTYHKARASVIRCHYCDHEEGMRAVCKECGSGALVLEGLGTERLEETLSAAFPEARVARLDRDVASGKAIEGVLAKMRAKEIDILVGTQMVTKGHDLPEVTLVGVINADAALSIPDFRAAERAFQLLVQVAGRAGRGDAKGRVLVQTYDPKHHAIQFGAAHDVLGFIERELKDRAELGYPPYSRLALVRIDAVDETVARSSARAIADAARSANIANIEVLGPAPAPVARVRGRYRFRVMLRAKDRAALREAARHALIAMRELPRTVRALLDVDPVQLM